MYKYVINRLLDEDGDEDMGEELVAVEYGASFDEVADRLCRAVCDDLSEMPENKGCEVLCEFDETTTDGKKIEAMGIVMPPHAPENRLVYYVIRVTEE